MCTEDKRTIDSRYGFEATSCGWSWQLMFSCGSLCSTSAITKCCGFPCFLFPSISTIFFLIATHNGVYIEINPNPNPNKRLLLSTANRRWNGFENALIGDITEARAVQHNQEGGVPLPDLSSARCRFIWFIPSLFFIYRKYTTYLQHLLQDSFSFLVII